MNKKTLLLLLSVILVGSLSVAGTVAYFTDADAGTNVFTVGQVGLTLDESDVNEEGKVDSERRVTENKYRLVPGYVYVKDPVVHIDDDSSDAWIFVRVVNEIAAIEGGTTVARQMAQNGWTQISDEGVYAYERIVSAGEDIVVFESFTIKGDGVDAEKLKEYDGKTITVTGYAVQADGFDTAAKAWDAYTEQNKEQNG